MEEKLMKEILFEIAMTLTKKGYDNYYVMDRLLAILKRYDPLMEFKVYKGFVTLWINGIEWKIPFSK